MTTRTHTFIGVAALATTVLLAGCGGGNGDSAPTTVGSGADIPDVEIPTSEEAEAAAAAEISADNADAAFEALSREIEADLASEN